jgi:hypothetical protein
MSKYQKQTKHTPISASDLVTHYDRLVSKIEILVSFEHIKLKAHIQFIAWQGHNCPQKREQYWKITETPFILLLPPEKEVFAAVDLFLELEYTIEQGLSSRGATWHVDVHRNNAVTAAHNRVWVVVVPTPICTASHWYHPPRLWHLVIDPKIANKKDIRI